MKKYVNTRVLLLFCLCALLLAGAAVLGLSFGVIPAAKAAGLPPAQALRTE